MKYLDVISSSVLRKREKSVFLTEKRKSLRVKLTHGNQV